MTTVARRLRWAVLVPLVGALSVVLVACSATSSGSTSASSESAPAYGGPAAAAPAAADGAAGKATDSGGAEAPSQAPAQAVPNLDRALVRTVSLNLDVQDLVASVGRVRTAAVGAGGYVSQEQTSDTSSSIVLQVPAATLDRTVDAVAGVGTVTSRRSETSDVTDTVVDLDARVASQKASVDRVRQLLAKATSIGDVVSIESELAQREADLDSLTSRLTAIRGQVALSTIAVSLTVPNGVIPPVERSGTGFLDGLATGWDAVRALGVAIGAIIGFLLPFVPVIALVLAATVLVRRTIRARRVVGVQGGPGSDGESSLGPP